MHQEVVQTGCSTLNIPSTRSRLFATKTWPCLAAVFFVYSTVTINVPTTHFELDHPILHFDHGRRRSHARAASPDFREFINNYVVKQHNHHGRDSEPLPALGLGWKSPSGLRISPWHIYALRCSATVAGEGGGIDSRIGILLEKV